MSARNGGRGKPPVPPEGHGPPPQEVQVTKSVTWNSQATTATKGEKGGQISFLVVEGGMPVEHSYNIGERGKKAVLEALSGGLKLP